MKVDPNPHVNKKVFELNHELSILDNEAKEIMIGIFKDNNHMDESKVNRLNEIKQENLILQHKIKELAQENEQSKVPPSKKVFIKGLCSEMLVKAQKSYQNW